MNGAMPVRLSLSVVSLWAVIIHSLDNDPPTLRPRLAYCTSAVRVRSVQCKRARMMPLTQNPRTTNTPRRVAGSSHERPITASSALKLSRPCRRRYSCQLHSR